MLWLVSSLLLGCGEEEKEVAFSNLPPFSPIVDLQPSIPYTNNDLEAIIVKDSIDPDGSVVTLTFLWYKDDVLQENLTERVVSADLTERGEIWTVAVISSDGSLDSADTRRSVTIRNSLPSIDSIELQWIDSEGELVEGVDAPTEETLLVEHENQSIMVTATASDGDVSDEITFSYEWEVDGVIIEISEDDHILPYEEMARGQDWILRVTANDGLADSEISEVHFGFFNAKPVIESITVTPAEPEVGEQMTCEAAATDGEEDEISLSYSWTIVTEIEDVEEPLVFQAEGDILDSSSYISGSSVTCTAVANDGMDDSEPFTSDAVVLTGNSYPVVDSVTITPEDPTVGTELTCEAMGSDPDGDTVTISYVWTLTVEDADDTELGTDATLDTSSLAVGDEINCIATANDGTVNSAVQSASTTLVEASE